MESTICTLYEGHYHYGVAALINSLHRYGFQGNVFIGYRGPIAPWVSQLTEEDAVAWPNAKSFRGSDQIKIHFLPVETSYHFTNYKPDFMTQVFNKVAQSSKYLFYFDPDIVNKCDWSFYKTWVDYGIAVVHEVTHNDMPHNHPKRHQWAETLKLIGRAPNKKMSSYLNAGFVGLKSTQLEFLYIWSELMGVAEKYFGFDKTRFSQSTSNSDMFRVGDQDLFNVAAMCCESPLSEFGPEAMDFINAGWLMSHTTGSPKSWKKNFLLSALDGKPPGSAEKEYWKNANGLITTTPSFTMKRKKMAIQIASFMGRFYRRY